MNYKVFKVVTDTTTILFIEADEVYFQYRQCVANVAEKLPDMNLLLATNCEDAIELLETQRPDVMVISDELVDDFRFLSEFGEYQHIPVILQSDTIKDLDFAPEAVHAITKKEQSLEEVGHTLSLAASMKVPEMGLVH